MGPQLLDSSEWPPPKDESFRGWPGGINSHIIPFFAENVPNDDVDDDDDLVNGGVLLVQTGWFYRLNRHLQDKFNI